MNIFNPAFLWLACGSASHLQDYKCSYILKYKVTLFPDHNQYDNNSNWKAIADYYFNTNSPLDTETVKVDLEWNQEEYEVIFHKPKDWRNDMYKGRNDVT